MATLALDAVRTVAGTLSAPDGGYPAGDWDVAIISLRAEDGSAIPPKWEVFKLDRDPGARYAARPDASAALDPGTRSGSDGR